MKRESEFTWDNYKKLTYSEFKDIAKEGELIPLMLEECKEILLINEKVDNWLCLAQQQVMFGCGLEFLEEIYKVRYFLIIILTSINLLG